jgi:hypothetical protein
MHMRRLEGYSQFCRCNVAERTNIMITIVSARSLERRMKGRAVQLTAMADGEQLASLVQLVDLCLFPPGYRMRMTWCPNILTAHDRLPVRWTRGDNKLISTLFQKSVCQWSLLATTSHGWRQDVRVPRWGRACRSPAFSSGLFHSSFTTAQR